MNNLMIKALSACTLFHGMDGLEIAQIVESVPHTVRTFGYGEIYAVAGSPCRYADIIITGVLVTRMSGASGKQMEVDRLTAGTLIAPAFIFAGDHSLPVSVEAIKETTVFRLLPGTLSELMSQDSRIRQNFIQTLSDINVFLTKKMRMVTLLTAREKVAFFLRERARNEHTLMLQLVRSRTELAQYFGIQRYSLIRVLNELTEEGIISVDGRTVTIKDMARLR